jgi:hypothetical protein
MSALMSDQPEGVSAANEQCMETAQAAPSAMEIVNAAWMALPPALRGDYAGAEHPTGNPLPVAVMHLTKERAGWKDEAVRLKRERDALLDELQARYEVARREVWYWQGDGSDFPDSLVCRVVMTAPQLRNLLAAANTPKNMRSAAELKASARAAAAPVAPVLKPDLVARCREVLAWKKSGRLKGDFLRSMVAAMPQGCGLRHAETATLDEAARFVVTLGDACTADAAITVSVRGEPPRTA